MQPVKKIKSSRIFKKRLKDRPFIVECRIIDISTCNFDIVKNYFGNGDWVKFLGSKRYLTLSDARQAIKTFQKNGFSGMGKFVNLEFRVGIKK